MFYNTKLSLCQLHTFIGEQKDINTLPIIYNARNEQHESNTHTVQKNVKTTMKVYLQSNAERTKNMFSCLMKRM